MHKECEIEQWSRIKTNEYFHLYIVPTQCLLGRGIPFDTIIQHYKYIYKKYIYKYLCNLFLLFKSQIHMLHK